LLLAAEHEKEDNRDRDPRREQRYPPGTSH
jgi:hypothetical protein